MDNTVRAIFNMACPACQSDQDLVVQITTWANLSAEGTDPLSDHHWHGNSDCCSHACGHSGKVRDFRINNRESNTTEE